MISEYVSNLEQSELAPNRNITVTIFEKMKGFEYELYTNTGTVGCSSHRDLASNYKLDPNRLESAISHFQQPQYCQGTINFFGNSNTSILNSNIVLQNQKLITKIGRVKRGPGRLWKMFFL